MRPELGPAKWAGAGASVEAVRKARLRGYGRVGRIGATDTSDPSPTTPCTAGSTGAASVGVRGLTGSRYGLGSDPASGSCSVTVGSSMWTRVPPPGGVAALTVPPWPATTRWHDGQPQPGSWEGAGGVGAVKAFEDVRQVVGRDTRTLVEYVERPDWTPL